VSFIRIRKRNLEKDSKSFSRRHSVTSVHFGGRALPPIAAEGTECRRIVFSSLVQNSIILSAFMNTQDNYGKMINYFATIPGLRQGRHLAKISWRALASLRLCVRLFFS